VKRIPGLDVRVVDVFAGGGGFSLGFGETVRAAIENHPHVVKTYAHNLPWVHVFSEDVKRVDGKSILEVVGEVDVVIGGPPCEAFYEHEPKEEKESVRQTHVGCSGKIGTGIHPLSR